MVFKLVLRVVVLLMLLSMSSVALAQQRNAVEEAIADAKENAELDVSMLAWGAGGFACSGFAVLYAYFSTPQVPAHQFIGKSAAYVKTYTAVYKQYAKRRRIQATAIGCGCGVAAGVAAVTTLFYRLPQFYEAF
jgi:hypothetical protein